MRGSRLPRLLLALCLTTALVTALALAETAPPMLVTELGVSFQFSKPSYTIEASASEGGVITPSGTRTVVAGGDIAFSLTPLSGYALSRLLINGGPVTAEDITGYRFSRVARDYTIHAEFTALATPSPAPSATPYVIRVTSTPRIVYVTASPAPASTGGGSGGGGGGVRRTASPVPSPTAGPTTMPVGTPAPTGAGMPTVDFGVPRNLGVGPS
ncbi:hypothetical protein LJC74_08120 [Eubacteriales bacterium OttesenSCG-928-A19]|nr:hypothetical protein [Eubacteriales bacterium OttesenSCG-928-A19]